MPERLPDLSVTEWAVLGIIDEGQTHGFSVARQFETSGSIGRVWTVPRPLVYRAIDSLVEQSLVARVGSVPGTSGPRRTLVEATSTGSTALRAWLGEPIAHVRDARSLLLLKLLLIDRVHADPSTLVERQRCTLGEMLTGLQAKIAFAVGFDEVLLRWRLYSVENLDRFLVDVLASYRETRLRTPTSVDGTAS